jgi:hypothetical protein
MDVTNMSPLIDFPWFCLLVKHIVFHLSKHACAALSQFSCQKQSVKEVCTAAQHVIISCTALPIGTTDTIRAGSA